MSAYSRVFLIASFLVAGSASAQQIAYLVKECNGFVFGTESDYIKIEQTVNGGDVLNPTTTTFLAGPIGEFRISQGGTVNPAMLPITAAMTCRVVNIVSASSAFLTFNVTLAAVNNPPGITLKAANIGVATVEDVHFSVQEGQVLYDSRNDYLPALVILNGKLTRGRTVVTPQTVNATVLQGQTTYIDVNVQTVGGLPFTGGSPSIEVFSSYKNATTGTITINPRSVGLGNYAGGSAPFIAPGVPITFVDVYYSVVQAVPSLHATPAAVTFSYVRGGPPPAPVTLSIVSSDDGYMMSSQYDGNWVTLSPESRLMSGGEAANIVLTPNMVNKPLGVQTTTIRFSTPRLFTDVPVTFYVADSPGTVVPRAQPTGGGTIDYTASVPNGTSTQVTARPAPGFVFTRWSGAISSTDNPATFVVNGTMNIVAEFTSATGTCTWSVSPQQISAPADGDVGKVEIQTQAGCPWTFSQPASWLTFVNAPASGAISGTGSGVVPYIVQPNTTSATRQTTILVGGSLISITQASSTCATLFAPGPPSFAAAGSAATITLQNAANCTTTPLVLGDWVSLAAAAGTSYTATAVANPGQAPRTASATFAGFRLPLLQRGTQFTTVFADVNASMIFADYINVIERSGVADTCAAGFCPDAPTLRSQMAEYLVHSMLRTGDFPYPQAPYFSDVPVTHPKFKWIQKLFEMGITAGCGDLRFCPDDSVTRAQMATFLVRARARITLTNTFPARAAAYFTDVPPQNVYFPYIQKLRDWGITAGCDVAMFCPSDTITRGQMAVFLTRAFFTP